MKRKLTKRKKVYLTVFLIVLVIVLLLLTGFFEWLFPMVFDKEPLSAPRPPDIISYSLFSFLYML
jgi:hypothetical protein